jgi:hypothetical protein
MYLALYYLVIRYGWKDEYIAKRRNLHFVAVGFGSTSVAALALDLFNPIGCLALFRLIHVFAPKAGKTRDPQLHPW